jgi:hypothetical protein
MLDSDLDYLSQVSVLVMTLVVICWRTAAKREATALPQRGRLGPHRLLHLQNCDSVRPCWSDFIHM